MPPLPNVKHEKYAQGLASGMKQVDAYEDAGFSASAGNASSLAKKPHIRERVLELSEEARLKKGVTNPIPKLSVKDDGTLTPASKGVTEEWLVQQLMNNVQQAQLNGKYREANTAIEMLGNYFGGLFDKKNPVDQTQKNKGNGAADPTSGKPSLVDMATKIAESLSAPSKDDEEDEDEDDDR